MRRSTPKGWCKGLAQRMKVFGFWYRARECPLTPECLIHLQDSGHSLSLYKYSFAHVWKASKNGLVMLLMYPFLMPGIIGLEGFPEQGRCRQDYSRLAELPATNKAIPALPPRLQHLQPYRYRARLSLQRLE